MACERCPRFLLRAITYAEPPTSIADRGNMSAWGTSGVPVPGFTVLKEGRQSWSADVRVTCSGVGPGVGDAGEN